METRQAIRSFLLDRKASNASPHTIRWYREKLERFLTRYPEVPETPDPLREFLRDLSCGEDTRHGYFRTLRALYNFLEEEYGFPLDSEQKSSHASPMKRLKAPKVRPKVMRSLTLAQLHQLLSRNGDGPNGARQSGWHLRDEAIVTLLADTGIRLGEALLRWDNIGEETAIVSGKTGEREVPLLPETRELLRRLKEWNDSCLSPSPYIFLGERGPLSKEGIYKVVRKAFQRAGLNGRRSSPHTLRHTFGQHWINEGGDEFSLQRIFGHTTLTMVRRYVAQSNEGIVRKHHRFSPLRTQARLAQRTMWGDEATITEETFSRS